MREGPTILGEDADLRIEGTINEEGHRVVFVRSKRGRAGVGIDARQAYWRAAVQSKVPEAFRDAVTAWLGADERAAEAD